MKGGLLSAKENKKKKSKNIIRLIKSLFCFKFSKCIGFLTHYIALLHSHYLLVCSLLKE